MAFIYNFFFFLKKFEKVEKVEKTGFFMAKFLLHCTLSLILGIFVNVLIVCVNKDCVKICRGKIAVHCKEHFPIFHLVY